MSMMHENEQSGQTFAQSVLIALSLVCLAVPNILFVWGWFTPWLAMVTTVLIVAAVGRAIFLSFPEGVRYVKPTPGRAITMVVGTLLVALFCLYVLFSTGLLGFVQSAGDLHILRTAMFCNLRDAAWPLILPNGKEMSYYLANVLPPALVARLFPAAGQWPVVLWTLVQMMLALLMLSSCWGKTRYAWGIRLIIATLCLWCASYPLFELYAKVIDIAREVFALEHPFLQKFPTVDVAVLYCCGGVYNSCPPSLLVAAMLLVCRIRAASVLPVALALMVPLSPFAGLALLPLVAVRWWNDVRQHKLAVPSLLFDALLPLLMAFLVAVYFLRADGESAATMACVAWGWRKFVHFFIWFAMVWLPFLLPLCFVVRRDAFFYALLVCSLLMPFFFIGSMSSPGEGLNNEFYLKATPPYMLLIVLYWLKAWPSLGWCKYCLWGICLLAVMRGQQHQIQGHVERWGRYLQVDDLWNGHLNHDMEFLNQSVPYCKEPLVPGVMLREPGESEKHFPGCLLPAAPGCDYSRPPTPDATRGNYYRKKKTLEQFANG